MRILSLGAGVQSSAIALMSERGELPRIDCAIFADTGWEPKNVYKQLDFIDKNTKFPIHRVSAGNIRDDLIESSKSSSRFASLPFFTENGGMGRRQCTSEYKIIPIQKKIRELLGYSARKRIPANSVNLIIGISLDEAIRMKPSRVKWIRHIFPLLENRLTRFQCLKFFIENKYPLFEKSSCIGCPYHSDDHWRQMKKDAPDEFSDAAFIDKTIRVSGKMRENQFMHRKLIPIKNVDLSTNKSQVDLFDNECDGFCGL